jgi:hypothetical protein
VGKENPGARIQKLGFFVLFPSHIVIVVVVVIVVDSSAFQAFSTTIAIATTTISDRNQGSAGSAGGRI